MADLGYKKEQASRPDWAHYGYIKEWFLNANIGNFAFLIQRLTGILIVLYLFVHLYSIGEAFLYSRVATGHAMDPNGAMAFNHGMSLYSGLGFHVLEYLLMLGVLYHMLNGLRVIMVDWFGFSRQHKSLFWLSMAIIVVVAIIGVFFFFPELHLLG